MLSEWEGFKIFIKRLHISPLITQQTIQFQSFKENNKSYYLQLGTSSHVIQKFFPVINKGNAFVLKLELSQVKSIWEIDSELNIWLKFLDICVRSFVQSLTLWLCSILNRLSRILQRKCVLAEKMKNQKVVKFVGACSNFWWRFQWLPD